MLGSLKTGNEASDETCALPFITDTEHFLPLGQFSNSSMQRNLPEHLLKQIPGPYSQRFEFILRGVGEKRVNVHFSQALGLLLLT